MIKADILQMVMDLNKALGPSALDPLQVTETFELCWPKLKAILDDLPPDGPEKHAERKPEDMLKELVGITRQTNLGVLESHRQILAEIHRLQSHLSSVANTMIPAAALSPAWTAATAEILSAHDGSGEIADKDRNAFSAFYGVANSTPQGGTIYQPQKRSQNVLRDRAIRSTSLAGPT